MNSYPSSWPEIARTIKDRAMWCCVRCYHEHDRESGHVLTVHHLDGDKANCEWWNLPALCQRCHLKIQAKVKMGQFVLFPALHSEWFKPYLAGRMQAEVGRKTDEEWVRCNYPSILRTEERATATEVTGC